jgi:hypothetical protein
MAVIVVAYAMVMFYTGNQRFAFDPRVDMSIVSHMSVHLLASIGATGVLYLKALKNGQQIS